MNARPNDHLRMKEISGLCAEIKERMSALGATEELFFSPKDAIERNAVDGLYTCVYRIIEEASNLGLGTMNRYPDIPWDQIRGLRNRIAHAYGDLDAAAMWEVASRDLDSLEAASRAFLEEEGLADGDRGSERMPVRSKPFSLDIPQRETRACSPAEDCEAARNAARSMPSEPSIKRSRGRADS